MLFNLKATLMLQEAKGLDEISEKSFFTKFIYISFIFPNKNELFIFSSFKKEFN